MADLPFGVDAPRFELEDARSAEEAAFVRALHARAERGAWNAFVGPSPDHLILAVDVIRPGENWVARTLRVDFFGNHIRMGPDPTLQLVTDLTEAQIFGGPEELAERAADWLEAELARTS